METFRVIVREYRWLGLALLLTASVSAAITSCGGGGGGSSNIGKMPPIIREFLSSLDDKEWQSELYKLLQSQSFNQVEVDLFELLCKVLDHNLFAQVDWARNSYYFKELKVGPCSCNLIDRHSEQRERTRN